MGYTDIGDIVPVTVQVTDANGVLANATAITLTITHEATGTIYTSPASFTVTNPSTGNYQADFTPTLSGHYLTHWVATGLNTSSYFGSFDVLPNTRWATTGDVSSLTGTTVTDAQLAQANAVIELHAGRTYDAIARTGARDVVWMRRAVAYQAAWMLSQPDMFSRLDLSAVNQEGRAVGLKDHALVLAPLAKRALARVSWLKSRSLHVRSPFEDGLGPMGVLGGPVIDYDDDGGW